MKQRWNKNWKQLSQTLTHKIHRRCQYHEQNRKTRCPSQPPPLRCRHAYPKFIAVHWNRPGPAHITNNVYLSLPFFFSTVLLSLGRLCLCLCLHQVYRQYTPGSCSSDVACQFIINCVGCLFSEVNTKSSQDHDLHYSAYPVALQRTHSLTWLIFHSSWFFEFGFEIYD